MRKWILGLLLLVAATIGAALLSPRPGVHLVRFIFDRGALAASEKLEKHVPADVEATMVSYDDSDDDAVLDIYRLPDANADAPTIVWVHGGGFVSGRRQDIANYLKVLAGEGFTVVNVDYTIAPNGIYPRSVRQLSKALDFLSQESGRLMVNPSRLVLAGDSAGAQIAAQTAAIISDPDYAKLVGITAATRPDQLAGVLLFCGVYDIGQMGKGGDILGWFVNVTGWAYSGKRNWRDDGDFASVNFIRFLASDFPPAFISVGNADPLGPQSVALAKALQERGRTVETLFFPPDHAPPLAHEYQFDLDTEAGQLALAKATTWLKGL